MAEQTTLGIVGAGTMGSGIALAALLADIPVLLYEISPEVLERAVEYSNDHLVRKQKAINQKYLQTTTHLEDLSHCQVLIEAIPENLELKQGIFARLDEICQPPTILATNTSTLSVTEIASATQFPHRVAGMHFFNPTPVMPLVEVIQGARTAPETMQALVRLAEKMGKTPLVASDTPGFIVNRVARPFYGEALRILGEGVATHEQIDRIVRKGGGFRMGPFELMDLIGIDINLAATQSIYEQTFYEPRYRPHHIQALMVAQRAFGRKTGRGFYEYPAGGTLTTELEPMLIHEQPPDAGAVMITSGSWALGMEAVLSQFFPVTTNSDAPSLSLAIVAAGRAEGLQEIVRKLDEELPEEIPILCQCGDVTLAELAVWIKHPQRLVGFDGLFFATGEIATLVAKSFTTLEIRTRVESFVSCCGRHPVWIDDSPSLVLPRIVCTLANEAAFALGEGVADAVTIDRAMQLGTNYPKGPLSWAREIGYIRTLAVLDFLHAEFAEDRYRAAPRLRQWARQEQAGIGQQNNR